MVEGGASERITQLSTLSPTSPEHLQTPTSPGSNPTLPAAARSLLLTIHCLIPTTLLPALDILDRAQIIHYTSPTSEVYYVQSVTTRYEVRVKAWNCSCAGFAFAAYSEDGMSGEWEGMEKMIWGGDSLDGGEGLPPVCKHLVACVLVEECGGLFGGKVERKTVDVEEAAGMAASWD